MKGLAGKVMLITGATSGIGRATAIAAAREGVSVVIGGRREAEGEETLALLREEGGNGIFVRLDVADPHSIKAFVTAAVAAFGGFDFCFNNAAISLDDKVGLLHEVSDEDFSTIMAVNFAGVFQSMKAEIPVLLERGGGVIVNTGSVASLTGIGPSLYVASKHALHGLTKGAALEYARKNIRINLLAPGGVITPMLERNTSTSEAMRFAESLHPIGRLAQADEVARTVLFMFSDDSAFMLGHALTVDGGFTAGISVPYL